jgi:hypothetical protein
MKSNSEKFVPLTWSEELARLREKNIDHYDYKHGRSVPLVPMEKKFEYPAHVSINTNPDTYHFQRGSRRVPMEDQIEIITIGRVHGLKPAA